MKIEQFYADLTESEKGVYNEYKENNDGYAYRLNDSLRKGQFSDFESDIILLDNIIKKYKHDNEIRLYRATSLNYIEPFISENKKYVNPEYLSTTHEFARLETLFRSIDTFQIPVLLDLKIPKNVFMAPFDSNTKHDESEREILLGREYEFDILNKQEITDREEINKIAGRFYGKDYEQIIKYEMEFRSYKTKQSNTH